MAVDSLNTYYYFTQSLLSAEPTSITRAHGSALQKWYELCEKSSTASMATCRLRPLFRVKAGLSFKHSCRYFALLNRSIYPDVFLVEERQKHLRSPNRVMRREYFQHRILPLLDSESCPIGQVTG